MCFPFTHVEPTTEAARKSVNHLKILALCEVIIAMLKMFIFKDILGGITELISCLVLWMAWSQLSYCICLIYILYICIIGTIVYSVSLLTPIQTGQPFFGTSGLQHTAIIFTFIFVIYYIIAAYLTFKAYKEFKAQQYESGGQGYFNYSGNAGGGQAVGGAAYNSGNGNNNQNYGTNYNYGGSGSGDTEAYVPPSSNNQGISATNTSTNRNGGGTQQFPGKGVRIG